MTGGFTDSDRKLKGSKSKKVNTIAKDFKEKPMSPEEIKAANASIESENEDVEELQVDETALQVNEEKPEKLSHVLELVYTDPDYKRIVSKGPLHEHFKTLIKKAKETENALGV